MVRICHVADMHFDASSKLDECVRLHRWISDDVAQRNVDLITLGGDLFERKSVPEDRNAAAGWVISLAEHAPVVMIKGNHEVDGDLDIFRRLDTRHLVEVFTEPGVTHLDDATVACLPWPRRSALLSSLGDIPRETANQIATDHLQNILRGMGAQMQMDVGSNRIFLGHVQLRGATVSTGQPLAPGADFELGVEDLALVNAHAYLLGHIHMGQEFDIHGAPCIYPGSTRRTAFGELEEKRYAIVEIDDNGKATVEYVPIPCAPMLLIEATYGGDEMMFGVEWLSADLYDPALIPGADIRFRYRVPADRREQGKRASLQWRDKMLQEGARSVKLEEQVIASTRSRIPEIAAARTLPEKLEAFWTAKNAVPDNARKVRLLGRLKELEESANG